MRILGDGAAVLTPIVLSPEYATLAQAGHGENGRLQNKDAQTGVKSSPRREE